MDLCKSLKRTAVAQWEQLGARCVNTVLVKELKSTKSSASKLVTLSMDTVKLNIIYSFLTIYAISRTLDIDECNTIPGLCKNGRCINTLGSYRCMCNKGYRPDHSGTRCVGKFPFTEPLFFPSLFLYINSLMSRYQ